MLPSEKIELAIYRHVNVQGTEGKTVITPLAAAVGSTIPLVIERLKGLHFAGHIKLSKYIVAVDPVPEVARAVQQVLVERRERPFHRIPYSEEGNIFFGPEDFFTQRDFIIEITPGGRRYFEQLEKEEEDAKQSVTVQMAKRGQSSFPNESVPPTIQPQQAIPLLRQQIQRLEEIMELRYDDPRVDAWESTTENILNAVYGLPNGEMHPNTFQIIKNLARGSFSYVGMREEVHQSGFLRSQHKRKALLEAYIEQLSTLPLAAPSPEEGTRRTKGSQTGSTSKHELIMGDKYEVHGQAGAVGPQAQVRDVTFVQTWNQCSETIDLTKLAEELSSLQKAMLKKSAGPEHYVAVGAVASAEIGAKNGHGPQVLQYLSKAGKWALDIATMIGAEMAAAALKTALGL